MYTIYTPNAPVYLHTPYIKHSMYKQVTVTWTPQWDDESDGADDLDELEVRRRVISTMIQCSKIFGLQKNVHTNT